jgi:hypothetical protein
VVVREDEPDLLMMKPVPAPFHDGRLRLLRRSARLRPRGAAACGSSPPKNARSRSSPPPKYSVRSRPRCRTSVWMLTTAPALYFAMFLNVVASIGPASGALLATGTFTVCADEAGVRSRRAAITMPTASDATAVRTM